MPKPTFLQSVLRKPTRSYADPYAASPWADRGEWDHNDDDRSSYSSSRPPASRYSPATYVDDGDEAGPSRRRRGPGSVASTVSTSAMSEGPSMAMAHRFPKPARKVVSNVSLRDGSIVHVDKHGQETAAPTPRRKKKKDVLPSSPLSATSTHPLSSNPASVQRSGTKKKKKVTRPVDDDETESALSTITSSSILSRPPPPIHSRLSETSSSAASSPHTPISPASQTFAHEIPIPTKSKLNSVSVRPQAPRPLLTPSSSERSTAEPSSQRARPLTLGSLPPPISVPKPRRSQHLTVSVPSRDSVATDDENEVFYTPRSSMESTFSGDATISETPKLPVVRVEDPSNIPRAAVLPPPPSFNFLPPTPAPLPDPPHSPFHRVGQAGTSSLHPERPSTRPTSPSRTSQAGMASLNSLRQVIEADDDAESASGQVASDDEEDEAEPQQQFVQERRGSLAPSAASSHRDRSQPPSISVQTFGTPASSVDGRDGRRSVSRQSTTRHAPRSSFDDFAVRHRRPSRPASEASFGGGSVPGSVSGYGKGGWAAAAASANGGRSGATSPVMYMPSGGDGWAQFHQPPPRSSRFTPLPASSQPTTFDKLVNGSRGRSDVPGSRTPTSYSGLQPPSRGDSSPSEYSQLSDGLPMPSRSYLTKDHSDDTSDNSSLEDGAQGANDDQSYYTESRPPASDRGTYQARAQSPILDRSISPLRRPMSSMSGSYYPTGSPVLGPTSPVASRPASRAGFEPPSFLNPDLLTILPEMSNEDSDRLYRPTQSESGRGRKNNANDSLSRRASMFKARSEVGLSKFDRDEEDETDDVGELPHEKFPRSKSVIGHGRPDESQKWEGSSYGDGVLMQSHGRDQETTGGYTNLVLPSGAYRPSNPAKLASELNSRILGLPHATMASITMNSTAQRFAATPQHLRTNLPPMADFSSHIKPPTKVGNAQLLVQVYAVAVDQIDLHALEEKGKGEVGKWVPGRSFVGRCLAAGADEKEVVRGDIVMGLVDVRKSGALSEYIVVDRRRISRAPFPTELTLEQLALLPIQGVAAARAVRTHLTRHSRALISGAHSGIPALMCQEFARAGVNVTAVIPGGDDSHEAHTRCMDNGARGVLMGSLAAVMLNLDEAGWDFVLDDKGGQRVYDAARRLLKDGGKLASTVKPESAFSSAPPLLSSRPSGLKTLRAAFGSRRKESKYISFEYICGAGSGEPEVDASGMDCRDIMEEGCMAIFRPVLHATPISDGLAWGAGAGAGGGDAVKQLDVVVPFEKGPEVFRPRAWDGVRVVRLIN